jgi:uncharacterized protein YdiU (UPF0061 family)
MNSDNMSILGLTLDYGPFGFLDEYNPGFICNHSDHHGRYSFQNQPDIGYFNLRCLAQALSPLVTPEQIQASLEAYEAAFATHYVKLMQQKLGLQKPLPEDEALVTELLGLLHVSRVDYTNFFRALGNFRQAPDETNEPLRGLFVDRAAWEAWTARYRVRLRAEESQGAERKRRMDRVNPKYVLRNYLAQIAIERATTQRDFSEIDRLRELLRDPFTERPGMESYAAAAPDWGKQIIVSCSS